MRLLAYLGSMRLRILFRGAFLLLFVAMAATVFYVLREEKQLSYESYRDGFEKNAIQIATRLRHPTGQLALLNPRSRNDSGVLSPVVLPYAAIDFDDQSKVQQAVEMAGCLSEYADGGSLCVAIGNSAWAGGFIYVAGFFTSGDLTAHTPGDADFSTADRVRVTVTARGATESWIAPFEASNIDQPTALRIGQRGRLTGFLEGDGGHANKPTKDFRGWLWQRRDCEDARNDGTQDCKRRSFFSIRVPPTVLREALFSSTKPVWPPPDLDQIRIRIEVLGAGSEAPLLDSQGARGVAPFSLSDLRPLLLPGETLVISRATGHGEQTVVELTGESEVGTSVWQPIATLIHYLPVAGYDSDVTAVQTIRTAAGDYQVHLTGDLRSVNQTLGVVATRVAWFVGAMLAAILLAWIVIELGIISRITELKKRAEGVTSTMKTADDIERFDLSDLKGGDELGILATCLAALLGRVREDASREKIRAEQEKDMWHAVGHEIVSPLQSLLALHGAEGDVSRRYVVRMQQAISVLYGSASPSEAFESTRLQLQPIDLCAFLENVAANTRFIGIESVVFSSDVASAMVKAEEYSLEDVITHILRNADRHRIAGSPIRIHLSVTELAVLVTIHNQGAAIEEGLLKSIFEYGVSGKSDAPSSAQRGQGLFVAKTYMAKMAGTIMASNVDDGVEFALSLPRTGRSEETVS